MGEIETSIDTTEALTEIVIEGEIEQEVQEVVCMSALSVSNPGVSFILVKGNVKNMNLTVLIDSGSTHSFIDKNTIKETGYQSSYCPQ